jgi:5-methylthioadenosine/S-adenosylhomocysteine deaminase
LPEHVDALIHGRWVVPVEPHGTVLARHAVAIRDGRIAEILPSSEALESYEAEAVYRLDQHVLIPGLVNAHTHAGMSLFRGLADDLPLLEWLRDHIWPTENKWARPDFVADGTRLAVAEMLRSGTTCFNDLYFFPDVAAGVAADARMRAVVGLILIDFPTAWAADTDEYLRKAVEVYEQYREHPLISTALAPHAPYTVSDEGLRRVEALAEELDLQVHIHVHETAHEISEAVTQAGQRPLARLERLGLVTRRLIAVHMTQLSDEEIALVADRGVHVVHCPQSNLKLASGLCPVQRLLEADVNVALGTDGAASNNDLDMIGEMRTAALLGKAVAADASAVSAAQALRMATLGGARALGLDDTIGSLVPGKCADIVAVDLGALETQPIYDPVSQLVYAAGREQVSDVWVAGRQLLRHRELTTIDEQQVLVAAREWGERIRSGGDATVA